MVQFEGFIPIFKKSLKAAMQIANVVDNHASHKIISETILDVKNNPFNNETKNSSSLRS